MLSQWPGGTVRLARRPNAVSRSALKLEEALSYFEVGNSFTGSEKPKALDLGASPGGWTQVLRQRGYEVTAVDPGSLAPALKSDPLITHEATTAGRFIRSSSDRFDLIVSDLRMSPERAVTTLLSARLLLRAGAGLVATLKTSRNPSPAALHRLIDELAAAFDIHLARQLSHNRNEVTVAGVLKSGNSQDPT